MNDLKLKEILIKEALIVDIGIKDEAVFEELYYAYEPGQVVRAVAVFFNTLLRISYIPVFVIGMYLVADNWEVLMGPSVNTEYNMTIVALVSGVIVLLVPLLCRWNAILAGGNIIIFNRAYKKRIGLPAGYSIVENKAMSCSGERAQLEFAIIQGLLFVMGASGILMYFTQEMLGYGFMLMYCCVVGVFSTIVLDMFSGHNVVISALLLKPKTLLCEYFDLGYADNAVMEPVTRITINILSALRSFMKIAAWIIGVAFFILLIELGGN